MNYIDPNQLFSIFEQGDEQVYKEHNIEDALQNPFVLMGMVLKGLENFQMMDMMYMKQYPEHYKNVRKITKYKYYNKLLGYLQKIDPNNVQGLWKIGESFEKPRVLQSLHDLMFYFEGLEQYEKCAIIKKYVELLKKTKESVGVLI